MDNYLEKILNEKKFINGMYVPWFHKEWFGFDIGKSIYDGYNKCFFDEKYVKSVFYNCKAMGFDMVKIWLNESFEGILYADNGTVIGVEPTFLKNLIKIFGMIKELDLKISICLNAHQEMYYQNRKPLFDRYMRYLYIPQETEKYIENWVIPILQEAKKSGCVPLIDIYAEPEADGGLWQVSRGVSWNTMVEFINRVNKAIKEFHPEFATTVSSGSATYTLEQGRYSDIEVDYLGADLYTDDGNFASTKSLMLDKRFMLGEYGLSNHATATEDDQVNVIRSYLENCKNNDVAAAFYWCYGWVCEKADESHFVRNNGELCKAASFIHYMQIDRDNELKGCNTPDVPTFLAITSPERIRWFGTRGAVKYILQQKGNSSFENIAEISAPLYDDYPEILKYTNENGTSNSIYRIIAIMPDGSEIISKEETVI